MLTRSAGIKCLWSVLAKMVVAVSGACFRAILSAATIAQICGGDLTPNSGCLVGWLEGVFSLRDGQDSYILIFFLSCLTNTHWPDQVADGEAACPCATYRIHT